MPKLCCKFSKELQVALSVYRCYLCLQKDDALLQRRIGENKMAATFSLSQSRDYSTRVEEISSTSLCTSTVEPNISGPQGKQKCSLYRQVTAIGRFLSTSCLHGNQF